MSSATARPACAAAPACSSTAASTAPCSISTPTWRRSSPVALSLQQLAPPATISHDLRQSVRQLRDRQSLPGVPQRVPPANRAHHQSRSWLTYDPYKGFQDPRTYDWNLAVEQQLTSSLSLRVAYVAEHSSHEWTGPRTESHRQRNAHLQSAGLLGNQQLLSRIPSRRPTRAATPITTHCRFPPSSA